MFLISLLIVGILILGAFVYLIYIAKNDLPTGKEYKEVAEMCDDLYRENEELSIRIAELEAALEATKNKDQ